MPQIRILPDNIVNQIAAGEVIERPAAVVKELLENSIDAGSTQIEIEFRNGGKNYIRIEDNGCGMTEEEALLSLERHATSKIRNIDDLQHVMSFGFRGEALPSIASVSKFTLQTRPQKSLSGVEILINGGKMIHKRECGMPAGTRIEVTHLFNSVPVRRKFLKSDQTESAHIIQLVRIYATAHPEVSFTLVEDGKKIFQSPICETLKERVQLIFGSEVADSIVPINAGENGLSLTGLISKAGISRSNKQEMITVVNGRPVDCRAFNFAIIESYFSYIPKGRYPIAFLFLKIDPTTIDVNVHPAKREIRFRNEPKLRAFIIQSIQSNLHLRAQTAKVVFHEQPRYPITISNIPIPVIPSDVTICSDKKEKNLIQPEKNSVMETMPSNTLPHPAQSFLSDWKFICNLKDDNGLFETKDGIVVINWRAAHERITYEKILHSLTSKNIPSQPLLFPLPIELDPITSASFNENLSFLSQHGIEVKLFGRNFFRIESLPVWIAQGKEEDFVRQLADFSREYGIFIKKPHAVYEQMAQIAISKACIFNIPLSPNDAVIIATKLMQCQNANISPIGNPTYFEISSAEITRRFNK